MFRISTKVILNITVFFYLQTLFFKSTLVDEIKVIYLTLLPYVLNRSLLYSIVKNITNVTTYRLH